MATNFANPPLAPLSEKGGWGDFERVPDWFRDGRVKIGREKAASGRWQ
jgi:hypothetical protein